MTRSNCSSLSIMEYYSPLVNSVTAFIIIVIKCSLLASFIESFAIAVAVIIIKVVG